MSDDGRIKLPERSTRGKRMRAQLDDEEVEADAEFWNQDFFAEDARDADYASEKEEEDVPDSDFFESESEEDDDGEVEVKERKKKTLKPPGAPPGGSRPRPRPAVPKAPASSTPTAAAAAADDDDDNAAAAGAVFDELPQSVIFEATYEAPTLRKSTRTRVEEAQKERVQREQQAKATKRPQRQGDFRVMTQEELLAEAMHTELDNLASLQKLLAREEETKKKANMKKQRFSGPLIRYRSRTIQVLVPPEVAAREQLQQQAAGAGQITAAAAEGAHGSNREEAGAAAQDTSATAANNPSAPATDTPGNVHNQVNGQQPTTQQQQQEQPPKASLPQEPVLQKQALDTLQCLGMKIPRWLLPQRAAGAVSKPICPITGTAAQYRDPLTGYYYGSAEAFRELRKRMGQPLPPPQSYAQVAVSPAAELQTLLASAAPLQDLPGGTAAVGEVQPAAAGQGTPMQQTTGLNRLPAGQQQLQQVIQQQVLQQMATAGSKGRGRNQGVYPQQQQQPVPDELAALVLQVCQSVHG